MIYVENRSVDPYFNLALEELLLTAPRDDERDETLLLLWQNASTVVIGAHQNAYEEIDRAYVDAHNVKVVRRLTGGGAVYHDLGNLNYTILTPNAAELGSVNDAFRVLSRPVVDALRALGVPAELSGRNDVLVDGKKISGAAQVRKNGRALCHGTLLFHSDLDAIVGALRVDPEKFRSKAVASVRARVGNLLDYLPTEFRADPIPRFVDAFLTRLEQTQTLERRSLSAEETARVHELRDAKYATWEWNFGAAPKFQYRNARRFDWGKLELAFDVERGRIVRARVFGDFFALDDVDELTRALVDVPFERAALAERLPESFLRRFLPNLTQEEFLALATNASSDERGASSVTP